MNFPSDRTCPPIVFYTALLFSLISWVYAPLKNTDFINFDDPVLVTGNSFIRDLSWEGIKNIFTTSASGVYIPLTEFVLAVEYHFFGYDPRVFHLTNLVFHLAVSFMVMTLGWRMGLPLPAGLLVER